MPKHVYSQSKWDYNAFRIAQKSFDSSDGKIKYIDQGEGDVILLLHGVPTSSWLYRKMMTGLVEEGFRVIAPDMLGFGSSDNPEGYELYSAEQHAKRILELMDYLEIKQWAHVMHDAGGLWTWEMLNKTSNRITHLIILNTIIFEEGFNPPVRLKKGGLGKFIMWLYTKRLTRKILLNQLFKKGIEKSSLTKNDIEGYAQPLREGKTNGMYYFFSKTCNKLPIYDSVINEVHVPVAVIWGKHDDMLTWEPQKEKVKLGLKIKAKDIHLIEAKHFIQETYPDKINSIILDFIRTER